MAQYIDKDALVAEIEKIKEGLQRNCNPNPLGNLQECLAAAEIEALNLVVDFINTSEVKEVDLEKIKRDWRNKGYIEGRKQALIPARKLGLPKSLNIIDMKEVKAAAKAWSEDDENTRGCDYIGATVAERAFAACAEWLINKAQKGE